MSRLGSGAISLIVAPIVILMIVLQIALGPTTSLPVANSAPATGARVGAAGLTVGVSVVDLNAVKGATVIIALIGASLIIARWGARGSRVAITVMATVVLQTALRLVPTGVANTAPAPDARAGAAGITVATGATAMGVPLGAMAMTVLLLALQTVPR